MHNVKTRDGANYPRPAPHGLYGFAEGAGLLQSPLLPIHCLWKHTPRTVMTRKMPTHCIHATACHQGQSVRAMVKDI
ncbi:hypothetical protein GCM10008110_03690 [Marinobacter persicus]|nr:hypothetical protein GCM10008110_03690 [Marinobacter persicus]